MKTVHCLYKYVIALILVMMSAQQLLAQEAFYIYRNDSDFNGFFYDQVKRMGFSKVDNDGLEHDVYVVQEIETEDSLYRIPLAAIDSIGFQQPEIRMNPRFKDLRDSGKVFLFGTVGSDQVVRVYEPNKIDSVMASTLVDVDDIICFEFEERHDYFGTTGEESREYVTVPYVCRVTKTEGKNIWFAPITDISEVFEQLISVEQIGTDSQGHVRSRMAGADQLSRTRGSHDLTMLDVNGKIGYGFEIKKGKKFTISAEAELKQTAEVTYNIGLSRGIYTKISISDELSANITASADIVTDSNDNLWEGEVAGGMPVMFPSFLPLFEIRPIPGLFLKAEGHATATIISPKLSFSNKRSFAIDSKQPWYRVVTVKFDQQNTLPRDEGNNWNMKLSLNGFVQMGLKIPVRIYTCSWARELLEMSIGADLYVGPKLSANFSLETTALADGSLYDALSDTKVELSALAIDAEVSAKFTGPDPVNWGDKLEETFKLLELGTNLGTVSLNLLPSFEDVKMSSDINGNCTYIVYPRGNYLPCQIGVALLDSQERFVDLGSTIPGDVVNMDDKNYYYSFWNSIDEVEGRFKRHLPFGKYKVCPAVYMFSQLMFSKSQGIEFIHKNEEIRLSNEMGIEFSGKKGFSGKIYILGIDDLVTDVQISTIGDEEDGDFFDCELGETIDPLDPDLDAIYYFGHGHEFGNNHYVPQFKWRELNYRMTGEKDDKFKWGKIKVYVTRDGITKEKELLVEYYPNI